MYNHWLLSYPSRSLNLYLISESVLDCVKTEPEDLTGANTRNRSDQEVTFFLFLKEACRNYTALTAEERLAHVYSIPQI